MPLTSVVEFFNEHLHQLHPQARLSAHAGLRYRNGILTAGVGGFRLSPEQVPVVRAEDGAAVAQSSQLRVTSKRGQPMKVESLYVHAWDAEDVIFLDRFLRVLHALHHLNQSHGDDSWLVLDVHSRHLNALQEHHGQVFRTLLERLGLEPQQIVLRIQGRTLQRDGQAQRAVRGFAERGYRLLVTRPELGGSNWAGLKALGVGWIAPEVPARGPAQSWALLEHETQAARDQGVRLWADGIDTARALEQAHSLGAELVEGPLFRPFSARRAGAGR